MLSKALKDLSQIKSKHDEIVTIYENILGYLSSDKCDIKELDHQKLEDLSCFLLKGLNLFTDLSDHIIHLQPRKVKAEEDISDDVCDFSFDADESLSEEQFDFKSVEKVKDESEVTEVVKTTSREDLISTEKKDENFKIISVKGNVYNLHYTLNIHI